MKREEETISLRRVTVRRYERVRGEGRFHRTIAEKQRMNEVRGEDYELLPAMMHLLKRYCADLPEIFKAGGLFTAGRLIKRYSLGTKKLMEEELA